MCHPEFDLLVAFGGALGKGRAGTVVLSIDDKGESIEGTAITGAVL